MARKKKTYDVGHKKPPVENRFIKGQSGNPKGRPKGARNFVSVLQDILNAPVTIKDHGKPRKVSSQEAALLRLAQKAMAGDPRALDKFINLAQQADDAAEADAREEALSATEQEILDRYVAHKIAQARENPGAFGETDHEQHP